MNKFCLYIFVFLSVCGGSFFELFAPVGDSFSSQNQEWSIKFYSDDSIFSKYIQVQLKSIDQKQLGHNFFVSIINLSATPNSDKQPFLIEFFKDSACIFSEVTEAAKFANVKKFIDYARSIFNTETRAALLQEASVQEEVILQSELLRYHGSRYP